MERVRDKVERVEGERDGARLVERAEEDCRTE